VSKRLRKQRHHEQLPIASELLLDARRERIEQVVQLRTRTLTVVLDRLEDSFNMAAILRTCEALGLQEVHVILHPQHRFSPSDKVTQGCDKWLEIHRYPDFGSCREKLKAGGFLLWASAIQPSAHSLFSMRFDTKLALVFGNERTGVAEETVASSDGVFWIPMRGFTRSLNVSAAVAATLSQAVRWRAEHVGEGGDLGAEERRELVEKFQILSVKQRGRIYGKEVDR
jgi:tRNA (guanosine-2'-O-)-methyltransferase